MELDRVLADLAGQGYAAVPLVIPAVAVDARHRRDRVWIVANRTHNRAGRREQQQEGRESEGHVADSDELRGGEKPGALSGTQGTPQIREGWRRRSKSSDGGEAVSDTAEEQHKWDRAWKQKGIPESPDPCRWPAEPGVGGAFDGLSRELDKIGGLNETEKTRAREVLQALRGDVFEEAFQWAVGRFPGLSAAEILLALMCELHEGAYRFGSAMESGEAAVRAMRSMWRHVESARSPHRRQYQQQHAKQYSNALRKLSHKASSLYSEAWTAGCWEDGLQRTTQKLPNRVSRIKGLGNAIVPQVAFEILKAIAQIERMSH